MIRERERPLKSAFGFACLVQEHFQVIFRRAKRREVEQGVRGKAQMRGDLGFP